MGRRFIILCAVLISATFLVPTTYAKGGDADKRKDAKARQLFRQGDEAYAAERYEDAVEAFTKSYELSGRPLMLYNIANALERLERWEDAANTLRTYRAYAPRSELRTVDARIASLTARAEREKLQMLREEQIWVDDGGRDIKSVRGVALISSGAASLLAGSAFAILAKVQRNKIDKQCSEVDGSRFCPSTADRYFKRDRAYSITADTLLISGLAVSGLGIYYLVRDRRQAKERDVTVGASVGRHGGSVSIRGSF